MRTETATATAGRRIRRSDRTESKVTDGMKDLARETYKEGIEKNAHQRNEAKARVGLYQQMKEAKVTAFQVECIHQNKRVPLDVGIETPEAGYVDVIALKGLVGEDAFLKIVSATQSAVKEHAGEAILRQVLRSAPGKENVRVKVAK
jgi:hypothetical protein